MPKTSVQPYFLGPEQPFAISNMAQWVDQANYFIGEYTIFVLLWRVSDFEAGLVERCSICYPDDDDRERRISEVYNQPAKERCPACLGTTFEGGWKAILVRPAQWDTAEPEEEASERGVIAPATASFVTGRDLVLHSGDYALRGDDTRWQVTGVNTMLVSDGAGVPTSLRELVGSSYTAAQEDRSSVVFDIELPNGAIERLAQESHYPIDFTDIDQVRAGTIL